MATLAQKAERLRAELGIAEGTPVAQTINQACDELSLATEGKSIGAKADAAIEAAGINLGSMPVDEAVPPAPETVAAPVDINITVDMASAEARIREAEQRAQQAEAALQLQELERRARAAEEAARAAEQTLELPPVTPQTYSGKHQPELYKATLKRDVATAMRLIEDGADVNWKNPEPSKDVRAKGSTTLHMACGFCPDLVHALLEHGADMYAVADHATKNALHVAAQAAQPQAVRVLLEHGMDKNVTEQNAGTARWYAAENNDAKDELLAKMTGRSLEAVRQAKRECVQLLDTWGGGAQPTPAAPRPVEAAVIPATALQGNWKRRPGDGQIAVAFTLVPHGPNSFTAEFSTGDCQGTCCECAFKPKTFDREGQTSSTFKWSGPGAGPYPLTVVDENTMRGGDWYGTGLAGFTMIRDLTSMSPGLDTAPAPQVMYQQARTGDNNQPLFTPLL